MGFNNRASTPLLFSSSPLLPQADSSEAHNVPTSVSPTTAKLHDWIAGLANMIDVFEATSENYAAVDGVTTWNSPAAGPLTFLAPDTTVDPVEVDVPDCAVGDVLVAWLTTNLHVENPGSGSPVCQLRLSIEEDVGGAGATSAMTGRMLAQAVTGTDVIHTGSVLVSLTTVSTAGDARVYAEGAVPSGGSTQMHLHAHWSIIVARLRK
jgi:hypothetical protein